MALAEIFVRICGTQKQGWRMVLQKLWVSQNFSRISRVSQSPFFLAVMCVSQSKNERSSLGVSTFIKVKGFKVPIRLFVLIKRRLLVT